MKTSIYGVFRQLNIFLHPDDGQGQGAGGGEGDGDGGQGQQGSGDQNRGTGDPNAGQQGQQGASKTGTGTGQQGQQRQGQQRQGQQQQQGQGQGQGQQQNRQGGASFTYKEDRSTWIPPHRLKETETAAEKRVREEMGVQLADRDKKLRIALGVEGDPNARQNDPEVQAARGAFMEIFPEFKSIIEFFGGEKVMDTLKSLMENSGMLIQSGTQTFQSLGTRTLNNLWTQAGEAFGIELSEPTKNKIFAAFKEELRANPEFAERYRQEDPALVAEFLKSWVDDFVTPLRGQNPRQQIINARQPLPRNGRQSAPVVQKPKPIPVGDMDAALEAAVTYAKDQGVQFSE